MQYGPKIKTRRPANSGIFSKFRKKTLTTSISNKTMFEKCAELHQNSILFHFLVFSPKSLSFFKKKHFSEKYYFEGRTSRQFWKKNTK